MNPKRLTPLAIAVGIALLIALSAPPLSPVEVVLTFGFVLYFLNRMPIVRRAFSTAKSWFDRSLDYIEGLPSQISGKPKRSAAGIAHQDGQIGERQARVYSIRVPNDQLFDPMQVRALISQLAFYTPIALRIVAEGHSIRWQVLDLINRMTDPSHLINAIKSAYPEAEVICGEFKHRSIAPSFYRGTYLLKQSNFFPAPLAYPEDFRQGDPLTFLVNTFANLREGERISYVVYIGDPSDEYRKKGDKLLKGSKWTAGDAMFIVGGLAASLFAPFSASISRTYGPMMNAMGHVVVKAGQKDPYKFSQSDLSVAFRKLNEPLMPVYIGSQIDSYQDERIQNFFPGSFIEQVANEYQSLGIPHKYKVSLEYIANPTEEVETDLLVQLTKWMREKSFREEMGSIFNTSELASLWHLPHEQMKSGLIERTKGKFVALPIEMQHRAEGILLGANGRTGSPAVPVYMLEQDRGEHALVVGKTGTGKSTFMHHVMRHDIAAGHGVALLDPSAWDKSIARAVLRQSINKKRLNDVVLWELGNLEYPPPLNILRPPPGVKPNRYASGIFAVLQRLWEEFTDKRMGRTLSAVLQALMTLPEPTLLDVPRLLEDDDFRHQATANLQSHSAEGFWERFERMKPTQRDDFFSPVLNRLEHLYENELLLPVICHPDNFPYYQYMVERKILLFSLTPPSGYALAPSEAQLVGSLIVSQFQMALQGRVLPEPFYLYIDEAEHFVTTSLPQFFSEARGQNLRLMLANQYLKQLVGSTLDAVRGNVGAVFAFQVGSHEDAREFAHFMRPEFAAEDLMHLNKYQAAAYVRYEGQHMSPFTLNSIELPGVTDPEMAVERERIIRDTSASQYTPRTRGAVLGWMEAKYPPKRGRRGIPKRADDGNFSDPVLE